MVSLNFKVSCWIEFTVWWALVMLVWWQNGHFRMEVGRIRSQCLSAAFLLHFMAGMTSIHQHCIANYFEQNGRDRKMRMPADRKRGPYPSRQRNYKCCITAYALVPVAKWNCVFSHSFSWCILLGKTSRSPTLMQRRPKVSFVSIKCVKSLLWCASQDSFRCTSHLLSTTSSGNEYYKLKMLMLCKQKAKMYSYRVCKELSRTRAIWICPLHVWQQRRRRRIT